MSKEVLPLLLLNEAEGSGSGTQKNRMAKVKSNAAAVYGWDLIVMPNKTGAALSKERGYEGNYPGYWWILGNSNLAFSFLINVLTFLVARSTSQITRSWPSAWLNTSLRPSGNQAG